MNGIKRGLIIGMAAMTAFSAINISVAAESEESAFLYREPTTHKAVELIYIGGRQQITLTCNGNKIELKNPPIINYDTVYVPLREMLETLNKDNYEETVSIVWNDGTIYLGLYDWSDTLLCQIKINESGVKFKNENGKHLSNTSFAEENISYTEIEGEPAILRGDLTYISVDMLNYIIKLSAQGNSNPEQFEVKYSVANYDGGNWYFDKECHNLFQNIDTEKDFEYFSMNIPNWWNGKYEIVQDNNVTKIYHKEIRENYDDSMGLLFYIEKNTTGTDEISSGQKLLTNTGGYKYIFGIATDVQYPTGNGTKDKELATEYQKMQNDLIYIRDSFRSHLFSVVEWDIPKLTVEPVVTIDKTFNSSDAFTNPQNNKDVVTSFLRCLEIGAFEEMKNYCTINCVQEYFGDGEVFGIKSAVADTITYPYKIDETATEKEIGITAKITPAPKSSFGKKEITATFKLHLIKQADGTYLIDSFSK